MNLRDLKYFIALAKHQHFGQAARACFVSQPALSIQIKKLEETLGVLLFERNSKKILLTDIGKKIAEEAQLILERVELMQEIAKQAKDPFSGELKLGIIPTLAPYLLPLITSDLTTLFSKLSFYLIEEQTAHLLGKLKTGEIDAAILALPILDENFLTIPLFSEPFLLAVPKAHPFVKRKIIKQSDLKDKNLLLLKEGHCLREQALAVCEMAKAFESKRFQATSLETLRYMIIANIGITLMPALAARIDNKIHYLPFENPKPSRNIGIVVRKSSVKKDLLEKIAEEIKKILKKQKNIAIIN